MEWQDLVGRTIIAVAPTRAGRLDGTIPNVLHLRFNDGSTAMICCDWATNERPWLDLDEDPEGVDFWLPEAPASGTNG